MEKTIHFYGKKLPFFEFSNFYPAPFKDSAGTLWPTTEHYYQAMKFWPEDFFFIGVEKTYIREWIWSQSHPGAAAKEGRRKDFPLRPDWEKDASCTFAGPLPPEWKVKDMYMYKAIYYKFTQHENLKQLLLSTGDAIIVEASKIDPYWGYGADGNGKNMLGRLLMKLRGELTQE